MDSAEEDAEWLEAMMAKNGYSHGHVTSDEKYICLAPFLFTTAIIEGQVGDDVGYERRWCYHKPLAELALAEWKARDFEDEPIGWTRRI